MDRKKTIINLPKEQLATARRKARNASADSVSGSLEVLLQDLIEQHGEPTPQDIEWAERVLAPQRR